MSAATPTARKGDIREPIAIVGASCRLPGAPSLARFWALIDSGAIVDPPSRSPGSGAADPRADIDWRALRLLPREAKALDPQQRLLLELTWEALEDAGIPVTGPRSEASGVFVGMQWNDYFRLLSRDWDRLDGYAVVGNDLLFAANRISFCFDLPGPSLTIDSGCASGLVALEQGCEALWSGRVDQAVVGAVDLILAPESQIAMTATGMLSKTGRCRPLDAAADGFVRGEGGVVLVLKPMSQVAEHERVHALICGVSSTHGGRNEWIMAPNAAAQAGAIAAACAQAGWRPAELDYVELHSAGSVRGDAVELAALGATVGARGGAPACVIGSVKPQIGHLGPVAGLAGLLKVAMALSHGAFPRSIGPETLNPALDLAACGLTLEGAGQPWCPHEGAPRRAGITALSLGGISAHAVLEQAPDRAEAAPGPPPYLLQLSARSPAALRELAAAYADWLDAMDPAESPADLCFTASVGRAHHEHRVAVCGADARALAAALREGVADPALPAQGRRFCEGGSPDLAVLNEGGRICATPPYPWQRSRMWPDWLTPEVIATPPRSHERPAERPIDPRPHLLDWSLAVLLRVLQPTDPARLTADTTLRDAGFDSIAIAEVRSHARRELGVDVSSQTLFDAATPAALATELERLRAAGLLIDRLATAPTDLLQDAMEKWTV